jgi:hypothetical protein
MPHTHFESFLSRVNDEVQRNRMAKRRPSGRIDIQPVKAAMLNDHVIYSVADGHRYFWMMGPEGDRVTVHRMLDGRTIIQAEPTGGTVASFRSMEEAWGTIQNYQVIQEEAPH